MVHFIEEFRLIDQKALFEIQGSLLQMMHLASVLIPVDLSFLLLK
jgi:hypothetical protein